MESIEHYHEQLKTRSTTVSRSLEVFLNRIEDRRSLNTLISMDLDGARQRARFFDEIPNPDYSLLPLFGIPFVIKDNIHVKGFANTAGTPGLVDFHPLEDHHAVKKLRDAGAIVIGKANMHELAMGITSNNTFSGGVANAHNPKKIAGGSSGGSAAAIADGQVLASLGTDTGGSVRIPAALNGICGFRPSTGRYTQEKVTPISSTRDTVGPLARTVSDLALIDAVISGDRSLPVVEGRSIRLGVPREYFYSELSEELATVTDRALEKLAAGGVTLIDVDLPGLAELLQTASFPIVFSELRPQLENYLSKFDTGISFDELITKIASPDVEQAFGALENPDIVGKDVYRAALEARQTLIATYSDVLHQNRLNGLVFPTTPLEATDIDSSDETVELNGLQAPTFTTVIRNTDLSSIVGSPSLSLPCGATQDGLPLGLEIDGVIDGDRQLLAVASVVEKLLQNP